MDFFFQNIAKQLHEVPIQDEWRHARTTVDNMTCGIVKYQVLTDRETTDTLETLFLLDFQFFSKYESLMILP